MKKWYRKKTFLIPFSIIMGLLGFGACFGSLLGVSVDDEFNKNYYKNKKEPLVKKRKR